MSRDEHALTHGSCGHIRDLHTPETPQHPPQPATLPPGPVKAPAPRAWFDPSTPEVTDAA